MYQHLKSSLSGPDQFKKRITWIEKPETTMPSIPSNVAIVKYIGMFPGRTYYGNVKHTATNTQYIRTKPNVRKDLKDKLKHRSVKEVEC